MTRNSLSQTGLKLITLAGAPLALLMLSSCSSPKPTTPPLVTQVSPGQAADGSTFGASTMVDTATATATVVSIEATNREIVLKRPNGKLSHCRARPGIVDFAGLKVGDVVTIAVGEERALALGQTALPEDKAPKINPVRMRVPEGLVALADAVETVAFTGTILAIDNWNRIVTLKLGDGQLRRVQTTIAVNLADFAAGDEVSVRITEAVVLTIQSPTAK